MVYDSHFIDGDTGFLLCVCVNLGRAEFWSSHSIALY